MANNGAVAKTMDGLTTTSVTIEAGYTSGGTSDPLVYPDGFVTTIQAIQTGGDLSDVTLWIADFSTWDGVTVTKGDKDTDGREITA